MTTADPVLAAEMAFFNALLSADATALEKLLTDDFILVDVMQGSEIPKGVLVQLIDTKGLIFEKIDHIEARARLYGDAAVITGRTQMAVRAGELAGEVKSRYTHVFVKQGEAWRFASAQGTQIVED